MGVGVYNVYYNTYESEIGVRSVASDLKRIQLVLCIELIVTFVLDEHNPDAFLYQGTNPVPEKTVLLYPHASCALFKGAP